MRFLLVLAVLIPRCDIIENPMYRPSDLSVVPTFELAGNWEARPKSGGETIQFAFEPSNKASRYRLSLPQSHSLPNSGMVVVLTENDNTFLDLTIDEYPHWGHHIAKLDVMDNDRISIRMLQTKLLRDQSDIPVEVRPLVLQKSANGIAVKLPWTDTGIIVTGSVDQLRNALTRDANDHWFGPRLVFNRRNDRAEP